MKKKLCTKLLGLSSMLFLSSTLSAIPSYKKESLPLPDYIAPEDRRLLRELIPLAVYPDSEKPNHYFFMPPMRIWQYRNHGAAGVVVNTKAVKGVGEATSEITARSKFAENYSLGVITRLTEQKKLDERAVEDAQEKLEEAIALKNEEIIKLRRTSLDRKLSNLEKSTAELSDANIWLYERGTLLPPGLGAGYFERALLNLAEAGADVPYSGNEDPVMLERILKDRIQSMSQSYGGQITVSTYGGFTKEQLDALVLYRQKYMPHISVTLLPVEKLTFFPLTEITKDHDGNSQRTAIH